MKHYSEGHMLSRKPPYAYYKHMNSDFICSHMESRDLFNRHCKHPPKGLEQWLENGLLKPLVLYVWNLYHGVSANIFVYGFHPSLQGNHKSRWD